MEARNLTKMIINQVKVKVVPLIITVALLRNRTQEMAMDKIIVNSVQVGSTPKYQETIPLDSQAQAKYKAPELLLKEATLT